MNNDTWLKMHWSFAARWLKLGFLQCQLRSRFWPTYSALDSDLDPDLLTVLHTLSQSCLETSSITSGFFILIAVRKCWAAEEPFTNIVFITSWNRRTSISIFHFIEPVFILQGFETMGWPFLSPWTPSSVKPLEIYLGQACHFFAGDMAQKNSPYITPMKKWSISFPLFSVWQ